MTKIILKNNKEYEVPVGGISTKNKDLIVKIHTDETLEDVRAVFEDPENIAEIRSVTEGGGVLMKYEGYTALDTKSEVDEEYILTYPEYDDTGAKTKEATTGRVITLKLNNPKDTQEEGTGTSEFDEIWKEAQLNG